MQSSGKSCRENGETCPVWRAVGLRTNSAICLGPIEGQPVLTVRSKAANDAIQNKATNPYTVEIPCDFVSRPTRRRPSAPISALSTPHNSARLAGFLGASIFEAARLKDFASAIESRTGNEGTRRGALQNQRPAAIAVTRPGDGGRDGMA